MVDDRDAPTRPRRVPEAVAALAAAAARAPGARDTVPKVMDHRYEIEELLGTGGVGQVYRALDRRLDRRVALKLIRSEEAAEADRLLREARAQAQVVHDNVAEVHEVGRHGGRPCVVMRLVDGPTLEAAADGLSIREAVEIVRDVARAVYAAHLNGLIHRDLKPGNVLLERRGDRWHPFVVDFGLATRLETPGVTAAGVVSGTPHYMAPEQIRGERSRSIDVWALGAILFRLIAGRPPHQGASNVEVLVAASTRDAPPVRRIAPTTPADLAAVVDTALRSAPEDRYPSAAHLADDLDRFLRGVPVSARPLGPIRRTLRWVRRHRALAAAAGAALVAVGVASGVAVRERLRASTQAALGQELGGEARDIVWWMRAVELAPRHDVRAERQEVRDRIRGLRRRLGELGEVAVGPASYAIGRAHLALSDPAAARRDLERAVGVGYRTADVSEALGTSLSNLYRDGLTQASSISDPELRRARIARLDAELAEPARRYLDRAAAASDDPLIRARRAFLDGAFDDAAALAAEAGADRIWRYEAFVLEAAAVRAEGDRRLDQGDFAGADATFLRAEAILRHAAEVAESSAEVSLDRCAIWLAVIDLRLFRSGADPTTAFEQADATCTAATEIAPDLAAAWGQRSAVQRLRGVWALRRGQPAAVHVERAIELAERGLGLAPDDPAGHRRLGLAHRTLARLQQRAGEDPRPAQRRALAALERSAALLPDAVSWSNLGLARSSLARQEAFHGGDPESELAGAVEALETAVELAPDVAPVWVNLSEVLKNRGVFELDHGRDARETLIRAVAAAEEAVELNPAYVTGWRQLGLARWYLGDARWQQADDPGPVLEAAVAAFREAQTLDPDFALPFSDAANVQVLRARVTAERGSDPGPFLAAADRDLDRAREIDPGMVWLHFVRGTVELERARWSHRRGADPRTHLDRAEAAFRRGLGHHREDPFVATDLARIELLRAEAALAGGRDPSGALERARAALEEALAIDPGLAPALAAAGHAQLLRARIAADSGRDPAPAIAAAEDSLAAAAAADACLARVPLLRARVGLLAAGIATGETERADAIAAARRHVARARELRPASSEAVDLAAAIEAAAAADPQPDGR